MPALGHAARVSRKNWTPSELFNGEDGDWWDLSDTSKMWQNTGKTTAVTADSDPVAVVEGQLGVEDWVQSDTNDRPLYKTSAGKHWLQFDQTNDNLWLDTIDVDGTWNYAVSHGGISGNFFLLTYLTDGTKWFGVGQSGSSSTTLASGGTQNDIYFDNVVSTGTTRGDQYTLGAASTSCLVDFTVSGALVDMGIGHHNWGGSFDDPADVYSIVLIEKQLSSVERALLEEYQQGVL